MHSVKFGCSVILALTLAACGGGSSGNGGSSGGGSGPGSYNQLIADGQEIYSEYNLGSGNFADYTRATQMPQSGKTRYTGVGAVELGDDGRDGKVAGRAQVVADFSDSSVSGTITDFRAAPGHRTAGGKLTLGGNIHGGAVIGDIRGNINANGQGHRINAPMEGAFLGDDADGFAAASSGRTNNGTDFLIGVLAED